MVLCVSILGHTQRDLSPKHAREAYLYIKNEEIAYWPEVFLAAREKKVAKLVAIDKLKKFYTLVLNTAAIRKSAKISISRVDGNHRLHFADGSTEGYEPITKIVSFCLAIEITKEQEIKLFKEINDNQRRMSTSHLDNITFRLTSQRELIAKDPDLYIAKKLMDDKDSPLFGMIYDGGKKEVGRIIPLRSLKTGLEYMFSRPTRLKAVDKIDVQTKLIKNYFSALKRWQPVAWKSPAKYLMLRGAGFWATCFLGAEVIDRALSKGKYTVEDMYKILKSGSSWNWSKEGDFKGFSGRNGAVQISTKIVKEFVDDEGVSLKSLIRKISGEA